MSRELFAETLTPRSVHPRSRWTIAGSFAAHLAVLAAIVFVPLTTAVDGPALVPRLQAFVIPAPPPSPPAPSPARRSSVTPPINPHAAPPQSGTIIAPESPPPSVGGTEGVPGLPVTLGGTPGAILDRPVTMLTAPPPTVRPVPVGGHIRPPQRIIYAPPVYPTIAQSARVEGIVILEAVIDETGAVRNVRVLRSIPLLDKAAIDAVSRWRYSPTQLNGVAVSVIMTVTVAFSLR